MCERINASRIVRIQEPTGLLHGGHVQQNHREIRRAMTYTFKKKKEKQVIFCHLSFHLAITNNSLPKGTQDVTRMSIFEPKWHSLRLLPFQGPKIS
jgi:hypothetical protein